MPSLAIFLGAILFCSGAFGGKPTGNSFVDRQGRSACSLKLAFQAGDAKEARKLLLATEFHFIYSPEFENYDCFQAEDQEVFGRLVGQNQVPIRSDRRGPATARLRCLLPTTQLASFAA